MRERKIIIIGIALTLVLLGLLSRHFLEPYYWKVLQDVERGIILQDTGPLILAGGLLAFLNTITFLPVFLGAFKLGQLGGAQGKRRWLVLAVVIAVVLGAGLVISWMDQDKLLVTAPLLVAIISYFLLIELATGRLTTVQEGIVLVQLILAAQWLELIPYLNIFAFGQAELPASIQIAAQFLNSESVLSFVGVAFFIPLTLSAGVTTVLINNYSQRLDALDQAKRQQEELQYARLQAVKARVSQEMHSLVHDLKTPLMTIRGLNSILELGAQGEKERQYCEKIEGAVANMNEMISEILYDEVRTVITVEQLINYVRAHVVPESLPQQVSFHLEPALPVIKVNKIRLARALINIIENALKATEASPQGKIRITVAGPMLKSKAPIEGETAGSAEPGILFSIVDNGVGIPEEDIGKIWQVRFSTGDTPGLGLDFVKKVVESHMGEVVISSRIGEGTEVMIWIPAEEVFSHEGFSN